MRPLPPLALKPLTLVILATLGGLMATSASAATFVVDSSGDGSDANPGDGICATAANVCTLRAAIEEANALPGADNLHFAIGSGPVIISPASALPSITSEVHIDGYTQPGSSPNTLAVGNDAVINVRIDGASAASTNALVFSTSSSNNSSVKGLTITRFQDGIILGADSGGSHFQVLGNFIGTDGSNSVEDNGGNLSNNVGILVYNGTTDVDIGTTLPQDRNLVVAAGGSLINLGDPATTSTRITNNYLGTDRTGKVARPAANLGIQFNWVGGCTVSQNVISAYDAIGIAGNANSNTISSNFIGVGADGTTSLPNSGTGISISDSGGPAPSSTLIEDNTIANFGGAGIRISHNAGPSNPYGNTITGNRLYNNTGLGIDLNPTNNAVNPNDVGDSDDGPNHLQNFPVINTATSDGSATSVGFQLNSLPNTNFRVEFFSSPTCHSSGYGQGKVYLGFTNVTTDATGNVSTTYGSLPATSNLHALTATATNTATGDTSEFSQCHTISGPPGTPPVVNAIPDQNRTKNAYFSLDLRSFVTATDGDPVASYTLTGGFAGGLSFNNGVLDGTPSNTGTFPLTFSATDKDGTSNLVTFNLIIIPAAPVGTPPVLSSIPQQGGTQGMPLTLDFSSYATPTDGDSITYTLTGSLPPGLSFNSSNGHLTGAPTTAGTYPLTLVATDKDGSSILRSFNLVISPAAPAGTPPILAPIPQRTATKGAGFFIDFSTYATATDGDPITYTLGGSLPIGVSFTPASGLMVGTPANMGTYPLTLVASDKDGNSAQQSFNLVVQDSDPTSPGGGGGGSNATPASVPVFGPLGLLLFSLVSGALGVLGLGRQRPRQ